MKRSLRDWAYSMPAHFMNPCYSFILRINWSSSGNYGTVASCEGVQEIYWSWKLQYGWVWQGRRGNLIMMDEQHFSSVASLSQLVIHSLAMTSISCCIGNKAIVILRMSKTSGHGWCSILAGGNITTQLSSLLAPTLHCRPFAWWSKRLCNGLCVETSRSFSS